MAKTLQIRVDQELRADADQILDQLGMDTPTAVRLFLKKVVQTRGIPFDLKVPEDHAELIPVDSATQARMDEIGALWVQKRAQ